MKKKHLFAALFLVAAFSLTACKQLDVIGNKSVASFEQVLRAIPDNVSEDSTGFVLTAPDGSAEFIWSKDFNKSKDYDVMIQVDAKPFLDAGLDITKLPDGMVSESMIMIGTNLGDESISYDAKATPLASYEKIVDLKRESIQYHAALDHFGIDLMEGNAFEWAKDLSENDKDIVFVLNPKMFIDAGVNPVNVDGWAFAKVETMDMDGKKIEVDKLLKPFNIQ